MLSFIFRKAAYSLSVLGGIIIIVFFLFNVLPGDPARMTQGQRSDVQSLEAARKELGLDQPLYKQFLFYLNDLSPLSAHESDSVNAQKYSYTPLLSIGHTVVVVKVPYLRRSYQTRQKVSEILWATIPNTALLALTSMLFASIIGIGIGIAAALFKDTWIDRLALSISVLGISAPSFFAGIIIAWLFGYVLSAYTGLNMSGSLHDYDPFSGEILSLKNLILPTLTLGIRPLAIIVQLMRSTMLDVLSQDYIRTAYAKGLSFPTIVLKHALKNALNPVLTAISGWMASLMAGAFFVEYIFGWNGLGKATVDALGLSDFPVVMGSVLFVALLFVIINILVDIAYSLLDPRIKIE